MADLTSDQSGELGELLARVHLSRPVGGRYRRALFQATPLGGEVSDGGPDRGRAGSGRGAGGVLLRAGEGDAVGVGGRGAAVADGGGGAVSAADAAARAGVPHR